MPFSLKGNSKEYEYRLLIQLQIYLTVLMLAYKFSLICLQGYHKRAFYILFCFVAVGLAENNTQCL